jgi:hypothetical protein
MSYSQYRLAQIQSFYWWQLSQFLNGFDGSKPTIILLPGGMGSELDRTARAYPANPNGMDETIWLDLGIIFLKDALKLEIEKNLKDKDSFVVAAHGPLRFLSVTPYDDFIAFARQSGWNICVFGYDWRRPLAESADFFKRFIYEFRVRVMRHGPDPIPKVNIVCHSMGGLVCATALRELRFARLPFHAIVTVATPFYGTSGQHDRYYLGEDLLNQLYSARTVSDIISSLPGPYSLLFLPKELFVRDGAKLGLRQYPMRDYTSGADTDPFDPTTLWRWPTRVRSHRKYLDLNRAALVELTKPVDAAVQPIFFNLRSTLNRCAVELLWENVDGDTINPNSGQGPISQVLGRGDGTVPFWSAWHAYSRAANRYELRQAKDHGLLFEHQEVMDVIDSIVSKRKLPKRTARVGKKKLAVASPRTVDKVMRQLAQRRDKKRLLPVDLFKKSVQRAIIRQLLSNG